MSTNPPYKAKDFADLIKEFGILLNRKQVQDHFKIRDTLWKCLVDMGVIKALSVDGVKSKYYSLLHIISIGDYLLDEQNFKSNQL